MAKFVNAAKAGHMVNVTANYLLRVPEDGVIEATDPTFIGNLVLAGFTPYVETPAAPAAEAAQAAEAAEAPAADAAPDTETLKGKKVTRIQVEDGTEGANAQA